MTNYILQLLWRDLTLSFDIVGPYYTNEDNVTARFISACAFETIKIFQVCWYTGYTCVSTFYLKTSGLKTNLPICDGVAPNLTLHMMLVGCMVYAEEQNLLW